MALSLSLGLVAACGGGGEGGSGGSGGSESGGSGGATSGGSGGSESGGSGGSASGGSGGSSSSGPGAQTPGAQDAIGWKKFLEDGEFRKGGWVSETSAVRAKKSISPHGRVRVWMNEKLKTSQAKSPIVYEKGSMVVKEMFDAMDKSVGFVSFWKLTDGGNDAAGSWLAHCAGDKDRCVQTSKTPSLAEPVLEDLLKSDSCRGCHHGSSNPTLGILYTKAPQ